MLNAKCFGCRILKPNTFTNTSLGPGAWYGLYKEKYIVSGRYSVVQIYEEKKFLRRIFVSLFVCPFLMKLIIYEHLWMECYSLTSHVHSVNITIILLKVA